jgi:DNA or RNA helicases of superfamily II
MSYRQNKYVDLKINGKLFPSWILENFKQFKLDPIVTNPDIDPCAVKQGKIEARKYQIFPSKFLDFRSPFKDLLLYHKLGSGKSLTAIYLYNTLYNFTPMWNVFLLTKAALKISTWEAELKAFLPKDEFNYRYGNIIFISIDSPIADKQFLDAVKKTDISKKSLYIIDEAHLFIGNVYSNLKSKKGKRAQVIYDYIINDKKENEGVRVLLLSGTPVVNQPFELALMFNLLRPDTFPKSESKFNQLYVSSSSYQTINEATKNMFQRRIMGLVSYYVGGTSDLYASKKYHYVDVVMSPYQEEIYNYFEDIEEALDRQRRLRANQGSTTYKSYTRQASNFVFPPINQRITGELRPRPSKFKMEEVDGLLIEEGKGKIQFEQTSIKQQHIQAYLKEIEKFTNAFDEYLYKKNQDDINKNHTLKDDLQTLHEKYNDNFEEFIDKEKSKSSLFEALYMSSAKMLNVIINILKSAGPVLVYSNYVLMEGFQIFKIYLKYFGFSAFKDRNSGTDNYRYTEFHGGIDSIQRANNIKNFNVIDNKYGAVIKIIMISGAGAEGLSLRNVRQVHILESYWHFARIEQMIGRAIRQCSHRDLPISERHVDVYLYKSVRRSSNKITTDQYLENYARSKQGLIESFLDAIKEVAIDCELFRNHNMLTNEYQCFKFDEPSLFEDQIGPAYKEDVYDDMKINNGLNSQNSVLMKIKVIKIKAVKQLTPLDSEGNANYSESAYYWYNPDSQTIYDFDLHYPIGKVGTDEDNLPRKLDKDTYIIDKIIHIPLIA